jgi:hypothetical protein
MSLFPAGNSPTRAFASPGVGMGSLSPGRQPFPVAQTAIAPQVHKPFDIHRYLTPSIALHYIFLIDDFPDRGHIDFGEIIAVGIIGDIGLSQNPTRRSAPDSMDIGEGDFHVFVFRQINTSYTCQSSTSRRIKNREPQPCRCLCFLTLQETRTIPLRLNTLQSLQIFLTDALTFMAYPCDVDLLLSFVLTPESDPTSTQVVGRKLDGNPVTREDLDEMHSHFA